MRGFCALILAALVAWPVQAADLPAYEQDQAVSGTVRSIGSDTLEEVVEAWAAAFRRLHPDVDIDIEALGSNTAPPALTEGRSDIGPMSRSMSRGERNTFKDEHGHDPVAFVVALDALAVYVHKDNPLYGLTLQQLDQIFSSTHSCGGDNVSRWDELVVATRTLQDIKLHSRNELSGTYDYFKEKALCGGEFKRSVTLHDSSADVVEAVAADINAIGYSGLGYETEGVRTLAIGDGPGFSETRYFPIMVERFKDSDDPKRRYAYVVDGRYPLSRPLYLYVNKTPGETLPEAVEAFIRFALSREGQAIVERIGFVPLDEDGVRDERRKLQADYKPRRWWWFD